MCVTVCLPVCHGLRCWEVWACHKSKSHWVNFNSSERRINPYEHDASAEFVHIFTFCADARSTCISFFSNGLCISVCNLDDLHRPEFLNQWVGTPKGAMELKRGLLASFKEVIFSNINPSIRLSDLYGVGVLIRMHYGTCGFWCGMGWDPDIDIKR